MIGNLTWLVKLLLSRINVLRLVMSCKKWKSLWMVKEEKIKCKRLYNNQLHIVHNQAKMESDSKSCQGENLACTDPRE